MKKDNIQTPRVLLVSPGVLPVPDTKGGAVERLIMMIVEDNERYKRLQMEVSTCKDEIAEQKQNEYSCTKFINLPISHIPKWASVLNRYLLYRFHFHSCLLFNAYYKELYKYIKLQCHKFDLIVGEGNCSLEMSRISNYVGKNKMCSHLHGNVEADKVYDGIYGNIVAVSQYILDKYKKNTNISYSRLITIFNGIDLQRFENRISKEERLILRRSLGLFEDDFVIIFCGRIVPQKGVRELIEAVVSLNNPNIKLMILGSSNFGLGDIGSYPHQVKDLINQHQNQILFTGFVPNDQIYKYHQISDIGIVPSTYDDPCPLSLCELISSGLPTIATKAGGMPEIGTPETTLYVTIEGITTQLSEAISKLYFDAELRTSMSESALKRREYFNRKRFYDDFCDAMIKIVHQNQ